MPGQHNQGRGSTTNTGILHYTHLEATHSHAQVQALTPSRPMWQTSIIIGALLCAKKVRILRSSVAPKLSADRQ